tara:strand:+ start:426 stop:740 length:315 start_codon:yes stop_codon:yes gene_type:complete
MAIAVADVNNTMTTIYTSTNNTALTSITFTNTHSATVSIDIHIVPNGSTASNTNLIVKTLDIDTTDTYFLYSGSEKLLLSNGDTIQAIANTASSINSVISHVSV